MISMDKKYKRQDGAEVVVKFTDGPASCPVGVVTNGVFIAYENNMMPMGMDVHPAVYCAMRLVEVSPYDDFKIDEPVMVRDYSSSYWMRGCFAGIKNDSAWAWNDGATKWTSQGEKVRWLQCRRPTAEELAA